jgi:GNAT superfamily N-acetyltransferase
VASLTRRPYRDSDAPALTSFMRDLAISAGADPGLTVDVVKSWFANGAVRDPASDTSLVFDDGQLAAAALLSPPPPDGSRVDAFGGVLPAWHGRGLGRELMSWSFDRGRQLRAELAPGAHWALDADAYSSEPRALRLFERFGMSPVRYWYEMAAELGTGPGRATSAGLGSGPDGPASAGLGSGPPGPAFAGLPVVPFTPELTGALYQAHNEAMADHFDFELTGPAEWAEQELQTPGFRPDLSRIALDGGEVAAYVVAAAESGSRIRMEEIGTRRDWRRRGLASSLLADVMAAAAGAGLTMATLGVDSQSPTGAVSIYQRAGFQVVSSWVSYRKPLD